MTHGILLSTHILIGVSNGYITYIVVSGISRISIKITDVVINLTFIGITGTTDVAGDISASNIQCTDPTDVFVCHTVHLATVAGVDVEGKAMT